MAKKRTFSHVQAQSALETVADSLTAENLPYEFLRVFCGYGESTGSEIEYAKDSGKAVRYQEDPSIYENNRQLQTNTSLYSLDSTGFDGDICRK